MLSVNMNYDKPFKSYTEFVNESFFSDEISKLGKRAIGAIKKFFGASGRFLNALVFQSAGKRSKDGAGDTIPEGVYLFPSKSDIEKLKEAGIDPNIPDPNEIHGNEKVEGKQSAVTEEVVPLEANPDSGVRNVDETGLKRIIERALRRPDRLPLMIWGAPGIAKTAIVRQAQESYGGRLIDLQLTTYAPEDFFLPKEDSSTTRQENKFSARATRIPQAWMPVYHESEGEEGDRIANGLNNEGGVLFLDELSRAREAIRNVCLKLVHEKKMDGGWVIGSKWRIIAASNRTFDDPETNASDFGTALSNRFKNYNFVPTHEDISKYMLGLGDDKLDPRIVAFLNWAKGEEYLHKLDDREGLIAWPSPRTWAEGGREWKEEEADLGRPLTKDEIEEIMSGYVGTEAASAFIKYLILSEKVDLTKLANVYVNPEAAPLPPSRQVGGEDLVEQDIAYIMASAIAYEKRGTKLSKEMLENVFKYTVRVNNPTIAMQILAALTKVHPYLNSEKGGDPAMVKVYIELAVRYFLPKYPGEAKAMAELLKSAIPANQQQRFAQPTTQPQKFSQPIDKQINEPEEKHI